MVTKPRIPMPNPPPLSDKVNLIAPLTKTKTPMKRMRRLRTIKGLRMGYIIITTPAIMLKIPEIRFHIQFFVKISASITEIIPCASQKMAKICISKMVVALGSYKKNMPITIAIIPSKKTNHQGDCITSNFSFDSV
jgi:hypothetical protein